MGVEGSHGTRCKPGARGLLRAEARPHKPSFLGGRMGSTVASAHVSPGGTMQGLPHVASMDSLLIPRSGDSTGGDARPACLRPGSTAALRRGDLFLQPLSQPSLHVPPPLCRAHGHPPGQGDSPHMPSQKSFKTCSVAKAIVPRCPSSPPRKEKGSVSAGLVFLPYCDSGQFVTPHPSEHHGKGWSFSAQ